MTGTSVIDQFSCAIPATKSSAFIRSTMITWIIRADGEVQKLTMTFPGKMAHRQAMMLPMTSKSNSLNWNSWLSKLLLKQRLLQLLQIPLNLSIGLPPMQLGLIPLLTVLPGPLSILDVKLSGSMTRSWISLRTAVWTITSSSLNARASGISTTVIHSKTTGMSASARGLLNPAASTTSTGMLKRSLAMKLMKPMKP